ncbi:MAG: hypothetical protein PHU63_00810 [Candidatus ainarchaeum sp.]|nr:hypothetical protein [Candidatus ainarchaeum sp.]
MKTRHSGKPPIQRRVNYRHPFRRYDKVLPDFISGGSLIDFRLSRVESDEKVASIARDRVLNLRSVCKEYDGTDVIMVAQQSDILLTIAGFDPKTGVLTYSAFPNKSRIERKMRKVSTGLRYDIYVSSERWSRGVINMLNFNGTLGTANSEYVSNSHAFEIVVYDKLKKEYYPAWYGIGSNSDVVITKRLADDCEGLRTQRMDESLQTLVDPEQDVPKKRVEVPKTNVALLSPFSAWEVVRGAYQKQTHLVATDEKPAAIVVSPRKKTHGSLAKLFQRQVEIKNDCECISITYLDEAKRPIVKRVSIDEITSNASKVETSKRTMVGEDHFVYMQAFPIGNSGNTDYIAVATVFSKDLEIAFVYIFGAK